MSGVTPPFRCQALLSPRSQKALLRTTALNTRTSKGWASHRAALSTEMAAAFTAADKTAEMRCRAPAGSTRLAAGDRLVDCWHFREHG